MSDIPSKRCPVSLLSESALTNPFPIYEQLRREAPVAFVPEQNLWLITRYDDCEFVLEHPELFSSREAVSSTNAYRRSAEAVALLKQSKAQPRARTLIMADPPEHTRSRDILQQALMPARTIRALTPRISAIVDELIDGFAARGECELVQELAYPLPMRVVAAILDVPDDDIGRLKAWSDDFISVQAGNVPDDLIVRAARRSLEFEDFVLEKLEDRRQRPKDDFLGRLVTASAASSEPLSLPELVNVCLQILVGGNESTTNFLGSMVMRVLTKPGLADQLKQDPSKTANVIEELLRAESPLQGLFRIAASDHDFNGTIVPKGAKVMLCFGSANRDEAVYGSDTEFCPGRDLRRTMHLAFGRGIHACAGQGFARREALLALNRLLERLPNLRISETHPPVHQTLFSIRGLKTLHLQFDAS